MTKRVWIGLALLALGAALVLLPAHVEMTGLVCAGYGALCLADRWAERHGRRWRVAIVTIGAAVFALLAAATAWVIFQGRSDWDAAREAEYGVVLGAQVRDGQPSRTLRERLDLALRFLEENPDAILIVSGGQGPDESRAEADAMYDYLAARGADMDRVYRERESHDTRENLRNSAALAASLGLDPSRPAILTSEFHLCRAKYIAGTLGMDAVGVGCPTTPWYLMVNYALREVFAFVKAWAVAGGGS